MHRKLRLPVDKLIKKPADNSKKAAHRQSVARNPNFQELYQMVRKNSQARPNLGISSTTTNKSAHQSISNFRSTPQNSARQDSIQRQLRKSLQTRSKKQQTLNNSLQIQARNRPMKGLRRNCSFDAKYKSKSVVNIASVDEEKYINIQTKINKKEMGSPHDLSSEYHVYVDQLNHDSHEHLRDTQCFLNFQEVTDLLVKLKFIRNQANMAVVGSLWRDLEGDMYGGVPSQNLLQFLIFVTQPPLSDFLMDQFTKKIKKCVTIDKNLKVQATQCQRNMVFTFYFQLRVNRVLHKEGLSKHKSKNRDQQSCEIKNLDQNLVFQVLSKQKHQPKKCSSSEDKENAFQQIKRKEDKAGKEKIVHSKKSIKLKNHASVIRKLPQPKQNSGAGAIITNYPSSLPNSFKKNREPLQQLSANNYQAELGHQVICYSQFSEQKAIKADQTPTQTSPQSQLIEQVIIKKPILSVDVNIGEGVSQKLIVFEGESAHDVSRRLVEKYNIDETLRAKFEVMLHSHIRNLLWKIEQVSEDMFSDRQQ